MGLFIGDRMRRTRIIGSGTSAGTAFGFNGTVAEVTSAGTTQADATPSSADCIIITGGATGSGIKLTGDFSPGDIIFISNLTGNLPVIYPPEGAKFNNIAINGSFSFSLTRNIMVAFVRADGVNLCIGQA